MRIIDCEQGTDEWFSARLGVPTASRFKDIITSQGKKAAAFNKYAETLVAERIRQQREEGYTNKAMQRGSEMEPQARAFYQFVTGRTVEEVGFCLLDDRSAGASPDGLSADRGLEIKCPSPHVHVAYLANGKIPAEYVPQVQGQLWVCERDEWDFLSFHPDMPPLLVTVQRDDQFIGLLASLVESFNERVAHIHETIQQKYAA